MTYKGIEIGEKPTLAMIEEFMKEHPSLGFVTDAKGIFSEGEKRKWKTSTYKPIKKLESFITGLNGALQQRTRWEKTRSRNKAKREKDEKKRMERYAELPMFDTLQPDVAYISAKATVRHTIDKDGNKSVCSVYVFMRNGDVVTVEHSDSKTKFQSVLDKWQPKEIQNVISAMSEMAETWSFLN